MPNLLALLLSRLLPAGNGLRERYIPVPHFLRPTPFTLAFASPPAALFRLTPVDENDQAMSPCMDRISYKPHCECHAKAEAASFK